MQSSPGLLGPGLGIKREGKGETLLYVLYSR